MIHSTTTNNTNWNLLNTNLVDMIHFLTNQILLLIDMTQYHTNKIIMPHLTKQTSINLYSMKLSTQLITRRRRRNIHQNLLPMNTEELTSQEDILPRQKPLMMMGWCEESIAWSCLMDGADSELHCRPCE